MRTRLAGDVDPCEIAGETAVEAVPGTSRLCGPLESRRIPLLASIHR
jgi:hypothetical protein